MMLQIAMIGTWHVHFKGYAEDISKRKDCRITVIWDHDEARAKEAARTFGCDYETDYGKVLAREDVQAVAVTSETSLHPDLLIKAAEAGKHIFTEKVLCFTSADAQRIRRAVAESGVRFCISFPWRCKAEYLYTKQVVDSGLLGQITYARVRNAHDGASAGWLPDTFYDPVSCGGGAMMDLGAHPMYLLLDLFGTPEAVTSFFTSVCGKRVEDNAVSILEYGGMIASSETGFVSANCPFTLEISGTKGCLIWGGAAGKLMLDTGAGMTQPALGAPLKEPVDQWADAILYGGEIRFGIDDAVELTRLMEKAYESSRARQRAAF